MGHNGEVGTSPPAGMCHLAGTLVTSLMTKWTRCSGTAARPPRPSDPCRPHGASLGGRDNNLPPLLPLCPNIDLAG